MPIPIKYITYIHGEPTILWEEEEVETIIIKEVLPFAIIGNFSFGWSELEEILKLVLYCVRFKAECKARFLSDRHILVRLTTMQYYLNVMSKIGIFFEG